MACPAGHGRPPVSQDQVRGISQAANTLSHLLWLFQRQEPEVAELVRARGSDGFPHYLTSRLGVLPEGRWAEAAYITPESLIEHLLPRCRELDPPAYVQASLDAAGRALRRLHPALPPAGLRELAGAASPEGQLPYAWASLPRSGDTHQDAILDAMVLREDRAEGHYRAAREQGLAPLQLLVLTALWRGQPQDAIGRNFKWSQEAIEAAAGSLRERGWVGTDGELTNPGIAVREEIERATDQMAERPLLALPEQRRATLVAQLSELAAV